MRHLIAAVTIGALSSVAIADQSIVSATATSRSESREWVLSRGQVQVLDTWLTAHRRGWRANVATPPTAALSIQIQQLDGTACTLEFFDQPGWSGSVILRGRIASLSAVEIASLRQQLGERGGE